MILVGSGATLSPTKNCSRFSLAATYVRTRARSLSICTQDGAVDVSMCSGHSKPNEEDAGLDEPETGTTTA